jgi:hypothetical protein
MKLISFFNFPLLAGSFLFFYVEMQERIKMTQKLKVARNLMPLKTAKL